MAESTPAAEEIEWVKASPEFGSALPNGSCNAFVKAKAMVCGFPRRGDGTCLNGHPAPPGWGSDG